MSAEEFDPEHDLDITGLEWWEVLKRLHDRTRMPSTGIVIGRPITDEQAMELIGRYIAGGHNRFDYVHGRPLKFGFHTKEGRSWISRVDLYDRDSLTPAKITIDKLRKEYDRKRKDRTP